MDVKEVFEGYRESSKKFIDDKREGKKLANQANNKIKKVGKIGGHTFYKDKM